MRNAAAKVVDVSSHSLSPSPRGPDYANRSAADAVGESQPSVVDDRCPAIRSHHEQSFFTRSLLQRDFIFKGDIVAIKKNVLIKFKRFARNPCCVTTRNRDKYPIRLRQLPD